jgi:hypothetical protein
MHAYNIHTFLTFLDQTLVNDNHLQGTYVTMPIEAAGTIGAQQIKTLFQKALPMFLVHPLEDYGS